MSTYLFDQLGPKTRSTLQSVGIVNDKQLAEIHPDILIRDIKHYYLYFPDLSQHIELEQIPRLCETAREICEAQNIEIVSPTLRASREVGGVKAAVISHSIIDNIEPTAPAKDRSMNIPDELEIQKAKNIKHKRDIYKQEIGNAIRYRRSFSCYIGAIATCIIYPIVVSALLFPVLMYFVPSLTMQMAKLYMGGAFLLWLIYYFCSPLFRCQVWYINIFSVRRFPRHRHAHRFPFFNTAIPTALVVMTRLWFRCPACGTSQKLFKRKRPRK